jgi:hypothetical protein
MDEKPPSWKLGLTAIIVSSANSNARNNFFGQPKCSRDQHPSRMIKMISSSAVLPHLQLSPIHLSGTEVRQGRSAPGVPLSATLGSASGLPIKRQPLRGSGKGSGGFEGLPAARSSSQGSRTGYCIASASDHEVLEVQTLFLSQCCAQLLEVHLFFLFTVELDTLA